MSDALPYGATIRVVLLSADHAAITAGALAVDAELRPSQATKSVRADGAELVVELRASDARLLRSMVASALDMAAVAVRTLREFGC